jgi:hypothetical protein
MNIVEKIERFLLEAYEYTGDVFYNKKIKESPVFSNPDWKEIMEVYNLDTNSGIRFIADGYKNKLWIWNGDITHMDNPLWQQASDVSFAGVAIPKNGKLRLVKNECYVHEFTDSEDESLYGDESMEVTEGEWKENKIFDKFNKWFSNPTINQYIKAKGKIGEVVR